MVIPKLSLWIPPLAPPTTLTGPGVFWPAEIIFPLGRCQDESVGLQTWNCLVYTSALCRLHISVIFAPPHATLSAGCFPEGHVKYIPLIYETICLDCQLIVNSHRGGSKQYGTGWLKSPREDHWWITGVSACRSQPADSVQVCRQAGREKATPATNQRRRRPLLNDSPHTPSRHLIPFVHSEGEPAKLSAVPNNYLWEEVGYTLQRWVCSLVKLPALPAAALPLVTEATRRKCKFWTITHVSWNCSK